MLVIYAEKQDMGAKIAAALDGIRLPIGTKVSLASLPKFAKQVKSLQSSQGFLDITFNGEPTKVTWGFGHLYGLKNAVDYNKDYSQWKKLPECFIPAKYELRPISHTEKIFADRNDKQRAIVKKLFNEADMIINSTDDDREGECIFAYVYEQSCTKKKTPYQRVRFTSQTEAGIKDAFAHLIPSADCKNIELAGRARAIYDWLIGANLTAQFTIKNPGNGVLSVGRVQTTVLKMIVDREKKARDFKSSKFWTVAGDFTTINDEDYHGEHEKKRFDTQAEAEAIVAKVKGCPAVVTAIESKKVKKDIPLLYSQTLLQMDANDKFGYTPDKTLEISQWLYEQGYTTYPRTKSQYLNDDMEPVVIKLLKGLTPLPEFNKYLAGKKLTPRKSFFDTSKVDSHFAIIPTEKIPDIASLTTEQKNIYTMIAYSVIRMIYEDAIVENTTVTTTVNGENFISKGTVVAVAGWMAVEHKTKEELLPALSKSEEVAAAFKTSEGETKPPARYTDKTILAAMKSAGKDLEDAELKKILADPSVNGIGTDATRAEILKTLTAREYIFRKGKTIYATSG